VGSGKREVFARDVSGKYPTQSLAVTVTAPLTTTVAFPLDLPGHVVGRVSDIYDAPLSGVGVTFQQSCCWTRTVNTDAEGRYDSGPLPGHHNYLEEFDYIIAFGGRGERYQVEYYDNAATAASARRVTVAPATTVEANATLDTLGRITGRVTDKATGLPVARVRIWIDDSRFVNTDDNGRYVIEGIRPASTVTLRFDADGYVSVSIPVNVALNSTLENQDVPLTPWGNLLGRVTDERTGRPLAGIWVKLYIRGAADSWYAAHGATTDANGNYAIAPHGQTYRIEFADPREVYHGQAYPDTPTIQEGVDVVFTPGQDTPNIDAALAPTGNAPAPGRVIYLPVIALQLQSR
jgi:5-hydroxyisourate hydrolase-like protein (transthyretin family)